MVTALSYERLAAERRYWAITQREMGEELGVTRVTYNAFERARTPGSTITLDAAWAALEAIKARKAQQWGDRG